MSGSEKPIEEFVADLAAARAARAAEAAKPKLVGVDPLTLPRDPKAVAMAHAMARAIAARGPMMERCPAGFGGPRRAEVFFWTKEGPVSPQTLLRRLNPPSRPSDKASPTVGPGYLGTPGMIGKQDTLECCS